MALVPPTIELTGVETVTAVAWNLDLATLNNFTITIPQNAAPTGISIELISVRTSVFSVENTTTSTVNAFAVKHRSILPMIGGTGGTLVPDQQLTTNRTLRPYDGTTDYSGTSGYTETTNVNNNYFWLHTDAGWISAMTGAGTFTLTMRVFHQDAHGPTSGVLWANSDWINGIVVVRVLTG